jgi:LCP family protein required for cell wall assembly
MVSGALLVLVGSGIVLKGILLGRNIFKGGGSSAVLHNQDVDPSLLKGEGDGRINIMVLGKGGAEQKDGPDLTDTIIIASIDPIAHEAALLSVPRDFWIKSPSGGQTKINQVYYDAKNKALNSLPSNQRNSDDAKDKSESAGVQAVEKVINDTLGIPVHYYSMIDFAGFKKAIDTVDGVDIDVNEDMAVQENMWINGRYVLDVKPGKQHFDGMRALAFSRSRKTSSRGDFARSDRQRAVMVGFKDKALNTGTLANPVKINQLMSDFSGQLGTDFSVNEILRLYDLAKEIPSNKITSVNLNDHVVGDTINSLSVQVPKAGLFEYGELKNYVRNTLRDAFLKREDAKIMILNGTEKAGLATAKSNDLKSYGYNISSVGDAPTKQYKDTVLVDLRDGSKKYTKSYLEKRLKITASSSLPDSSISTGDADFVIILGSNETSR